MSQNEPKGSSMTGMSSSEWTPPVKEVVITRVFNAPRELMFKLWTDPEHVKQWWSPHYFTTPLVEMDVRPGGAILIHMQDPDGVIYPDKGVFNEIAPPERLVFTSSAIEDENGNPQLEAITTVTFEEEGGKTRLTLRSVVTKATPEAVGALAGMEQGWSESLEKLETYVGTF